MERRGSSFSSKGVVLYTTLFYFLVELACGIYLGSLALITDAAFMATNIAAQLIAILANRMSRKPPDQRMTFGYERVKVISGLVNGVLVGFVLFYVVVNAYGKIMNPHPIDSFRVLIVALLGLVVNGYGVLKLYSESAELSTRGVLIFAMSDALGSVGVIISSIIMKYTGFYTADGIMSIIIGLLVAYPTYFLIKDSINILMEGTPAGVDTERVKVFIRDNFREVSEVGDMHIWALEPQKTIMLAKIGIKRDANHGSTIRSIKSLLTKTFGFREVWIEPCEEG
jgi:cobalt-zinc-cadmium efflux system protein